MILSRVSEHLKGHHRAAVTDMAIALEVTPEALREMLGILERKGRVRMLPSGTACAGGCNKCNSADVEIYEWVGSMIVLAHERA